MTATFHVGDAIEVMSKLPAKSVDLVLTSPPFLALRSYLPADHPLKALEGGSQSTPGEYIDWLIDIVEACDRVLAPHGSLVFELGDTYSGSGGAGGDYNEDGLRDGQPIYKGSNARKEHRVTLADGRTIQSAGISNGLPRKGAAWPLAKSLSLIPETFRWAMVYGHNPHTGRQTAPWRLRNVIRWVRPNPPVGALGDKFRPATSELMVFCKSAKRYFDLDAVREVGTNTQFRKVPHSGEKGDPNGRRDTLGPYAGNENPAGAPPLDWWNIPLLDGEEETRYGPEKRSREGEVGRTSKGSGHGAGRSQADADRLVAALAVKTEHPLGSPPLDWWNIPPGGYPGAHYATWPEELCIKPIKAMCPSRVCRTCGEPSRRIVETEGYRDKNGVVSGAFKWGSGVGKGKGAHTEKLDGSRTAVVNTVGWTDCGHDDWRPGLVLDPFAGSGTTLAVATGHGRDAIGIDLDARNFDLALGRVGPFILERAS